MEAAMKIRIEDCCFFACGLIFLCLFGADTAVAQRGSTLNRDSEPNDATTVPVDVAPHLEIARGASDRWAPPDIDEVQFPVVEAETCPLSDIVSKAGTRVEELIQNLDRFAATEVIQHQSVNHSGNLHRPESRKFNYVFSMKEAPDGYMNVEEYRNRGTSPEEFPEHIATLGMPSLVLVFHPHYEKNFRMSCEGLGKWHGQPAWQVRFEQRSDRMNNMSAFVMEGKTYHVNLRGRGWILADSYQVAHMEMDLAEAIAKIRLRLQHMAIEYLPVSFPESGVEIWLPSSAELYVDFRGHRFYRRHTYMNFQLFSVKVQQTFDDVR
jgi:hypothetical protein